MSDTNEPTTWHEAAAEHEIPAQEISADEAARIIQAAREASHPILLQSGDGWETTTRLPAGDHLGYIPVAAIETGGCGDLVMVDPASGQRLWVRAFGQLDADPQVSVYDAMRKLIDIAEAQDFLNEEGGE